MEEIKVGEYVRNDSGIIIKVKKIEKDMETNDVWYYGGGFVGVWKSRVLKHSPNIIDLIEVGDYVNGHLVIAVDREKLEVSIENCMYGSDYEDINGNIDIKSIVTKEQFNSIKYVIGE